MGSLIDTSVFIDIERSDRSGARPAGVGWHALLSSLGEDEEVGIAAITASELLHGVHRAAAAQRPRRESFVESVLQIVPTLAFDLLAARVHARLWASLAASGKDIGAHDRLVAATAISLGWRVATANVRHFRRVPGLDVVAIGSV